MTQETTDDQLMELVSFGDKAAFEALVFRWQPMLIRYFSRATRDLQHAEDLCQETLMRVHRSASRYHHTSRFRHWISRIAKNLLIDRARSQRRDVICRQALTALSGRTEIPLELLQARESEPGTTTDAQEISQLVCMILDMLPEEQRVALLMYEYEQLNIRQIASATDTPAPTIKSRLRLARRKLQNHLSGRSSDASPDVRRYLVPFRAYSVPDVLPHEPIHDLC